MMVLQIRIRHSLAMATEPKGHYTTLARTNRCCSDEDNLTPALNNVLSTLLGVRNYEQCYRYTCRNV